MSRNLYWVSLAFCCLSLIAPAATVYVARREGPLAEGGHSYARLDESRRCDVVLEFARVV